MHPVLFKIPIFGGVTIYTYGVMVALGFIAGMIWVAHESRRVGVDPAKAIDLVFYIILAAIAGSRIMDIIVSDRQRFLENPLMIFKIWEGGLVFYGGLIASLLVGVWFVRRHRLPFLILSDVFAPAIALGHAIGRIGCFLVGCCYGKIVSHTAWYTVMFPKDAHSFAPAGVPLYPTQLMESFGELMIFGLLVLLGRRKKFDGQVMAVYLMIYPILRIFNEHFRDDVGRGFVIEPWVSVSQFVSILIFIVGVIFYVKAWKLKREAG